MSKDISSSAVQRELSIRSENIQRVYNYFINELFFVNRKYQRKLIWTIEEKRSFIDSVVKGYPVPLILLAAKEIKGKAAFEIIDGMQRLNTITSFVEGEFDYNGSYFDLETMVESKSGLDKGILLQKEPKVSREICEKFASYVLPLSVYSFSESTKIDEIFIRINSYGKHLSRQELRSAGTLGVFADLVRQISSEIRTDITQDDVLSLDKMKNISITNIDLNYGIPVEDIFWVKNNVITKEMVREAGDEEIVSDILAAMSFNEIPPTSSLIRDEYYGLKKSDRSADLEMALYRIGVDMLKVQFIIVYNVIRNVLDISGKNFGDLIFKHPAQSLPRYFQIIFLAFYKLLIRENKEVSDYEELIKKLDGISDHIKITEGGNWSSSNRTDNVNGVAGIIQNCFKEKGATDPAYYKWLTEFETLLMQSKTEQALYDFKQGFLRLDGNNIFDEENFSKIILTLTAIANNSPLTVGYVCVGVSDNAKDGNKVRDLYGVIPNIYRGFYITGIGHEHDALNMDADKYFRWIMQKVEQQPISNDIKDVIGRNIRYISYYDKEIITFKITALRDPMLYDKKYYCRHGANIHEIQTDELSAFFKRFL